MTRRGWRGGDPSRYSRKVRRAHNQNLTLLLDRRPNRIIEVNLAYQALAPDHEFNSRKEAVLDFEPWRYGISPFLENVQERRIPDTDEMTTIGMAKPVRGNK
jgi:hypothetical protein